MTADHITQPYTLSELRAKIASHEYSAELLLQHAMLLLDRQSPAEGALTDEQMQRQAAAILATHNQTDLTGMLVSMGRAVEKAHVQPKGTEVPQGPRTEFVLNELRSALSAMTTFFGMDEDEASKPTFDKARQALSYAEIVMRPLEPWERQSLEDFRACVHRWHEKAVAKGYDGVEAMCDTALPYGTRDLRLVSASPAPAPEPTLPVEIWGKTYEVPIPVQVHITRLQDLAEFGPGGPDAPCAAVKAEVPADMVLVPREPTPGLLMSMALRYDHGLGMPGYYDDIQQMLPEGHPEKGITHARRLESTLTTMRQLHEEVVGAGFYKPEREASYAAMGEAKPPVQGSEK